MKDNKNRNTISRKKFLKDSATAAAAFTIVPRHVLGGQGYTAPSDKLNIGCIGVGGKGRVDVHGVSSQNIVALCDVDQARATEPHGYSKNAYEAFPEARRYEDFRVMLDKEKDLDGVTISTPDHVHAIATIKAMERGLDVYTQKPLTHTINECSEVVSMANKTGVTTQMGIQNHAKVGPRILCELVWQGTIGKVNKVHCWTDRPVWPQGKKYRPDRERIPHSLDWNLWLGPAEKRAYNPAYVPFTWRGWWDYGEGALGDMGCHIFDYPNWALKFGSPLSVEASSTAVSDESPPRAAMVTYYIKSELSDSPVKLVWYDGGLTPATPRGLENKNALNKLHNGSGVILYGESGTLVYGHKSPKPVLVVNGQEKDYPPPRKAIPRSPGFYNEWIRASKGSKTRPTANFDYSGPLAEKVLLGVVAIKSGKKLLWDDKNKKVTNVPAANQYLKREYRKGWNL